MLEKLSLNKEPVKIRRALISVFYKEGVLDLAKELNNLGVEILSTGGTAKLLNEANVPVVDVSAFTGFPEIMSGRVKTLHPNVAAGILGLRDEHSSEAEKNNIKWIDLVVCNLYPFSDVVSKDSIDLSLALENIDIGGPTMVRSAAKNLGWTVALVDPDDYSAFIDELKTDGFISFETRRALSTKAFGHTASYDTIIHNYLSGSNLSDTLNLSYDKAYDLRYGENPHQKAAVYSSSVSKSSNSVLSSRIIQGKQMSYNNIMDSDGALACLREFSEPACVIVKHSNPCGVAVGGNDMLDIYNRAFNADSLSAFGGIISINRTCTTELAEEISKVFVEIVLAPSFDPGALDIFSKKKNLRVVETGALVPRVPKTEIRNIDGGVLVQETDILEITESDLDIVTASKPGAKQISTMLFGWRVLKHIKSNAILIAKNNTTVGVGAGQVSRVDAVDIAIKKAGDNIKGSVLCSDAFFPFRDSIDKIAHTGIKAIIQPGGSIRDKEVIEACNENDIAMVFTGSRCFKH